MVGISFIEKEALRAAESMFEVAAANIVRSLPEMTPAKKGGEPIKKTFQVAVEYKIPTQLDYDEIDKAPSFPGCEDVEIEKSKECFSLNLSGISISRLGRAGNSFVFLFVLFFYCLFFL